MHWKLLPHNCYFQNKWGYIKPQPYQMHPKIGSQQKAEVFIERNSLGFWCGTLRIHFNNTMWVIFGANVYNFCREAHLVKVQIGSWFLVSVNVGSTALFFAEHLKYSAFIMNPALSKRAGFFSKTCFWTWIFQVSCKLWMLWTRKGLVRRCETTVVMMDKRNKMGLASIHFFSIC